MVSGVSFAMGAQVLASERGDFRLRNAVYQRPKCGRFRGEPLFGADDAYDLGCREGFPEPRERLVIAVFEDAKNRVVGIGRGLEGGEIRVPK